ncbi:sugar ABC transporter substrate-binding protein [Amycolatopsis pigmentata]|uniref:Sugar ABC transporter substrate-binding protein n=1 Tax=Amycolatopsis pigmentata TaxID=450801 RepID=A0ABW5G210_9PSEU
MTRHRRIPLAILSLSVGLALTACSTGSQDKAADGAKPLSVAYAGVSDADPLYKALGDGLARLATAKGVKLNRYDNNADATQALSNANLIVGQKPDVAIDWDGVGNTNSVGQVFTRAKLPCVAVNLPIAGCSLYDLDQVGAGTQLGTEVAKIAAERGWAANDMFVLLESVTTAGMAPINSVGGFYSEFAKHFPGLEQRAPSDFSLTTTGIGASGQFVDGVGTVDGAYAATQRVLQTIPAGKKLVIDVLNDAMVPGVLRALEQAGRQKDVLLASTGALPSALAGVRTNPIWVAEGDAGLSEWPRYLLAMSRAIAAGEKIPDRTLTPFRVVTKSNVDTLFDGDASKTPLPVPSADSYLLKYDDLGR